MRSMYRNYCSKSEYEPEALLGRDYEQGFDHAYALEAAWEREHCTVLCDKDRKVQS